MENLKIWILLGVVSVLAAVLAFIGRQWFIMISSKMERIYDVLSEIKEKLVGFQKDIDNIKDRQDDMHTQLNDHSKRILDLERNLK